MWGNINPTRVLVFAIVALQLLWLIGQVFRDATLLTAHLFYIPSPVVALAVIPSLVLYLGRRDSSYLLPLLLGSLPLLFVLVVENRWFPRQTDNREGGELTRVVHWNVKGLEADPSAVAQRLLRENPDIALLSELTQVPRRRREFLGSFVGWSFQQHQDLGVLTKGSIAKQSLLHFGEELKVIEYRVEMNGRNRHVFLVDIISDKSVDRAPIVEQLYEYIEEYEPGIVVGDFNMLRRSRFLGSLPSGYVHAYEQAGSGWSYTYAMPLPVWAIDQCLLRGSERAVSYEIGSTMLSDHGLQILELAE